MCKPTFFGCPYDDVPRLGLAFEDIRKGGPSQARIFAVQAQNLFSTSWPERLVSLSDALANQGTPKQDVILALSPFELRTADFLYTGAFPVTIQKLFLFHSNGLERLVADRQIEAANYCYDNAVKTLAEVKARRSSASDLIEAAFRPVHTVANRHDLRTVDLAYAS